MSLTAQEVIAVMEKAKELGLKQVKVDGFEASFEDIKNEVPVTIVPDAKLEEIFKEASALDQVSDDEILYYATPYYDQLQAEKEAKKQRLSEEVKE